MIPKPYESSAYAYKIALPFEHFHLLISFMTGSKKNCESKISAKPFMTHLDFTLHSFNKLVLLTGLSSRYLLVSPIAGS